MNLDVCDIENLFNILITYDNIVYYHKGII